MNSQPKVPCSQRTSGKFVILRGVLEENFLDKFFSSYTPGEDPTKMTDGTVAYRVVGFADTVEEAQIALYGRVCG